jgi:hypothetical protein
MHFFVGFELLVIAIMLLLVFMGWKSCGGALLSSQWESGVWMLPKREEGEMECE